MVIPQEMVGVKRLKLLGDFIATLIIIGVVIYGVVMKMVDMRDSKPRAVKRDGSIPSSPTTMVP